MNAGEIFSHSNPREILVNLFQQRKEGDPNFSVRSWSRQLGYKNPSYLSEVLRGRRRLKPDLAKKISNTLDLPNKDKKYFEALVFLSNAKNSVEEDFYKEIIDGYMQQSHVQEFIEGFVPDFINHTLTEMVCLEDFTATPRAIAKRLGPGLTTQSIELALNYLVRHGQLRKTKEGAYAKRGNFVVNPKTSRGKMRNFTGTMLRKAAMAFDEQPPETSYFHFHSIALKKEDFPKIKELVHKWRDELVSQFGAQEDADDVYEININAFKLTLGPKEANHV